jgi:hypothetical protein
MTDVMKQRWACLTCFATFPFGRLKTTRVDAKHPHGLACPTCGDGQIHPADGKSYSAEYLSDIGEQH